MRGLDVVGADSSGLVSSLFSAAGAGVDMAKQSQTDAATAASDNAKLQAAVNADKAATAAVAKAKMLALVAATLPAKVGVAKADQMAADAAVKVQDTAGAAVPDSKTADRVKAAQAGLDAANVKLQDALRSGNSNLQQIAQCGVDAAQQTLDKANGGGGASGDKGGGGGGGGGSFFSRAVLGPIKIWMLGLAGVAGAGFWYWKAHKK